MRRPHPLRVVGRATIVLSALGALAGLAACAEVQPWEKQQLARDTMKPSGTVPSLTKFDGHVYYSREAARGGLGVGGGGCGCN